MSGERSESANYTFFDSLPALVGEAAQDSIVSRTIFKDAHVKAVLFSFAAGQSLSEHSAAQPATLHVLSGTALLTLGGDAREVGAGAWAHMPPRLPHSITAHTPVVLLLLLLSGEAQAGA